MIEALNDCIKCLHQQPARRRKNTFGTEPKWRPLHRHRTALTLREGKQQQGGQARDDGGQQQDAATAHTVDGRAEQHAGQRSRHHAQEVAEVEVRGEAVQVPGEAVLDPRTDEPAGGERRGQLRATSYKISKRIALVLMLMLATVKTGTVNTANANATGHRASANTATANNATVNPI